MYGYRHIPVINPGPYNRRLDINAIDYGKRLYKTYINTPRPRQLNPPPYIYLNQDVVSEEYITQTGYWFLLIFFILFLICILLCRYRMGIQLIKNSFAVIGWIFWAIIFYFISLVGFVVNMLKSMILWFWGLFAITSKDNSIESWYWGEKVKRKFIIDGEAYEVEK